MILQTPTMHRIMTREALAQPHSTGHLIIIVINGQWLMGYG
jgi:hypothetical protein